MLYLLGAYAFEEFYVKDESMIPKTRTKKKVLAYRCWGDMQFYFASDILGGSCEWGHCWDF
jgi:hypothetical protein